MKKYKLICMSFDGDHVIDSEHDTIDSAWDQAENMGSKWFFYPFCFVCTNKTVKDTPIGLSFLKGLRIQTVVKLFKKHSENPITHGMNADQFILSL